MMFSILFWVVVLLLSVIVGAILPKLLGMLFRIALYFVAFFLVLWGFYRAGLVPEAWSLRVKNVFLEFQKKSAPKPEAKKFSIPLPSNTSSVIFFTF